MKNHITAFIAIGILVVVAAACGGSFTTANISKLEFGKNDKASPATTTFDVGEKIFAVATVSNTSGKHKMNYRVTYENVAGKTKGEEALNENIDFEGARPIWLSFSVPAAGEYKIEATLNDDTGKKVDSKSGTVTAKGGAAPPAKEDDN